MLNISPKLLKRASMSVALATTLCAGMALAQDTTPQPQPSSDAQMVRPSSSETNTMDHYLNNHPDVAKQLHEDPSLINNPQWLASHPKVQSYMNSHPAMKADAATHPGEFVNHTERQDLTRDHKALNGVDALAHDHPQIANELKNNPKLIDDPKYLAQHPGLDSYLAQHPEIRQEAQAHPNAFAKDVERNNKYNEDRAHRAAAPPTPPARTTAARK
ncbi:MAG TPA: hypothetical protein VK763_09390 [Terriglobales bacterium]|nr:hypothetical protein [Terriglobales bacterium]